MTAKFARRRTYLREESGQGLIELIVSLTILAVAIGALLTVATSSALSLQRSDQKGTALMLAEQQIEVYRNLTYAHIRLDQASLNAIPANDPYRTANTADPTIPPGPAGEIGDPSPNQCADPPATTIECNPTRIVIGPDHRTYRVDTYIVNYTPVVGQSSTIIQVTVVVRNMQITTMPILAKLSSTFSPVNAVLAKGQPYLTVAAPAAANTGNTLVPTATLSGGSAPTGTINYYYLGPQATPPTSCVNGNWQSTGLAVSTVTGNATYTPAGTGFSPSSAGTYWWYATYSGDSGNNPVNSGCGATMTNTVVTVNQVNPTLHLTATPSVGTTTHPFTASAITAQLSGGNSPTGTMSFYVSTSPGASAPACPGSGWSLVGTASVAGNGSYSPATSAFTPMTAGTYWWYASYGGDTNNAVANTCTDTPSSTSVGAETFTVSLTSPQTAGTSFSITVTAKLNGGATDTAYTGSRTLVLSGAAPSPNGTGISYPASVTFTNGQATFSITVYNAASTNLTVTDGTLGISGTSSAFTVNAGAMSAVSWSTVAAQTAGTSFGATLSTSDAWGNPVNYNGTKTVTVTGGANSPAGNAPTLPTGANITFTNGSGPVSNIVLKNAATTTLTANVSGIGTGSSNSFAVNAAAAAKLGWTAVTNARGTLSGICLFTCTYTSVGGSGTTFKAKIAVTDTYGNIVSNVGSALSVTVTKSAGTFTGSPTVSIPAAGLAVSNSGGDGTVAGEITFNSQSGGWTTNTLGMNSAGGFTAAAASFSK